MTVALVGAGTAALRAHLPALGRAAEADAVRVVAVVDPHPEHREEVARRSPGVVPFDTVAAMLDATRPDLVIVASPPSTHLAAVRAAFAAGVDVVCEKPLGVAPGDADEIAALVGDHPERLLVAVHQYRYAPAWARIQSAWSEAVAAGEPARLTVEVERPGTDPLSSGGWRTAGLREGGVMGDHGVHYLALAWTLDPALRVTGAEQAGESGRERAAVELELDGGDARVSVSYAGTRRRNLVELQAGPASVRWLDGSLEVDGAEPEPTLSLADRQSVNDLYGDLYDEVLQRRTDAAWRRERSGEAVTVARLLSTALDAVR